MKLLTNAEIYQDTDQELWKESSSFKNFNPFLGTDLRPEYFSSTEIWFNADYKRWLTLIPAIYGETKRNLPQTINDLLKEDFYLAKDYVRDYFHSANLDVKLLADINKIVLRHYEDKTSYGPYGTRDEQVRILRTNRPDFRPVAPSQVPELLAEEIRDYYETLDNGDDALSLFAIFKFYVNTMLIHPFNEGNGRVGRSVLEFLFLQQNYILPLIYDLEQFFLAEEKTIKALFEDAAAKYEVDDPTYADDLLALFAAFIVKTYRVFNANWIVIKTNKIDFQNDEETAACFVMMNETFDSFAASRYLKDDATPYLTKLQQAGQLTFDGQKYYRKTTATYSALLKTLTQKSQKLTL